jgi:predicted HD phosphohydrolase
MAMDPVLAKVDKAIQALSIARQSGYIGEDVTQLEHALQCAYFAEKSGHSEPVILASLFHDIGHFSHHTKQNQMAELGVVYHEWIGAKLIYDLGFSAEVALLIGHHVDAKRYLAAKKPEYYARLSDASKGTLAFQGGPMSENEMRSFEENALYKQILQVRVNDEKSKEVDLVVPDLDYYRNIIYRHIEKNLQHQTQTTHSAILPDFVDNKWVQNFKMYLSSNDRQYIE